MFIQLLHSVIEIYRNSVCVYVCVPARTHARTHDLPLILSIIVHALKKFKLDITILIYHVKKILNVKSHYVSSSQTVVRGSLMVRG